MPRKIIAIVERIDHVCTRYRIEAFRGLLSKVGYEIDYRTYPTTWRERWNLAAALRPAEAVLLQRKLPGQGLLNNLRRAAKKLIFDYDDAIWMRDSYSPRGLESAKLSHRFQALVSCCDLIVAGNDYLADHAKRFTKAPVIVIPTCIDPGKYRPAAHTATGKDCRLVWIGSASTLQGVEQFRAVLEYLGQCQPGMTLRLVCDQFLEFKHLSTEKHFWQEATEAESLQSADVGISYVPDDAWSRGKCGLKVLQYQAAGLPVIANPVGVHTVMIQHNRNGYLATEPEEWLEAVRMLTKFPQQRRDFGLAGRAQLESQYSVTAGGLAWIDALQKLFHRPQASA